MDLLKKLDLEARIARVCSRLLLFDESDLFSPMGGKSPQTLGKSSVCGPREMVPVAGVEPARHRWRWILSPLRLPIPSYRHIIFSMKILENSLWKSEAHLGGPSEILKIRGAKKRRKNKGFRAVPPVQTNWILSPLRLPIPSYRRMLQGYYNTAGAKLQVQFCPCR